MTLLPSGVVSLHTYKAIITNNDYTIHKIITVTVRVVAMLADGLSYMHMHASDLKNNLQYFTG